MARAGQAPERRVKVGFLGTSYSHFAAKHRLLADSPEFDLVGLCDDDPAVRARAPQEARWLTRPQLFEAAELIVVESAVANHSHDAREALLAGRHVHLEKPPAASFPEFQELLRLASERQRLLQVGYMWRYHPGIVAVLKAAKEGWLGEVFLVRGMINTYGNREQRGEWAKFRGGIMFELGCHLVDPLVRLLGTPARVTSVLQQVGGAADELADNTVAVFEYPRALGIVSCAARQPGAAAQRSFEVSGTQGTARVLPLEPPTLVLDLAAAAGPYAKGQQEVPLPPYQRYVDEFAALAKSIRSEQPLPFTPEQDLAVQLALVQACRM